MHPEVELKGKVYRRIGDKWFDTNTFICVPSTIARKLDLRLLRAIEASNPPEPQPKPAPKARKKSKGRGFRQEDVFPVIADLIHKQTDSSDEFVTHHDLVDALLEHPEGRTLAEEAVEKKGHSVNRWAAWMVQSFSQRMSADDFDYQDEFDRTRVDGIWAYRAVDG